MHHAVLGLATALKLLVGTKDASSGSTPLALRPPLRNPRRVHFELDGEESDAESVVSEAETVASTEGRDHLSRLELTQGDFASVQFGED